MSHVPRARLLTLALPLLAISAVAFGSCGSDSRAKTSSTGTRAVADGASIGKIERSAGGTAVVTDVRSLLALTCGDGQVTVRTNRETLIGSMDCSRMISQAITDRFLGQPVAVTYSGGNLQLESPAAGIIVLPGITNLAATGTNAAP